MFLPKTSFDQESLESVGKKDNHSKSQVGRVQMLIALKIFFFKMSVYCAWENHQSVVFLRKPQQTK